VDVVTGVETLWSAGPRAFVGEPEFVPFAEEEEEEEGEDHGWVVGWVFHAAEGAGDEAARGHSQVTHHANPDDDDAHSRGVTARLVAKPEGGGSRNRSKTAVRLRAVSSARKKESL
jgi:hypothetical protein